MNAIRMAAEAGNRFAARLHEAVRRPGESGAVGPVCVSGALTLMAAGARGETREEMVRGLGWDDPGNDVEGAWGRLLEALREPMREIDLRVAAGVWVRKGVRLRREFAEVARTRFGAEVRAADFERPGKVTGEINEWAARNTAGKIRQLARPESVGAGDVIVGTTTYLKGAWMFPFEEANTVDGDFRVAAGRTVRARMMRRLEKFPSYAETESCQVMTLSYGGGEVQMVVALPKREDGLEALEREVAERGMEALGQETRERVEVDLWLPRFSVRGSYELAEALSGLGMGRAFGAAADFSGAVDAAGPFGAIEVVHEVVVDVDERGTEAAAGTLAVLCVGIPRPGRRVEFKADHPFLFMIVHRESGAILFMGRVVDPSGERAAG